MTSERRICPECMGLTDARTCPSDGSLTVPADNITGHGEDPRIGRTLAGRYKVIKPLGAGGMGSVYLAEQLPIGRKVALKLLHRRLMSDITAIKRFQREARAVASLNHPNTIKLHDFGQTEDEELFLAMEYLEGQPLDVWLTEQGPADAATLNAIVLQILQSLSEAHARGFVHRDIKPQNLFISSLPGQTAPIVKVLDFGIAKMVEGSDTTLTGKGLALGSPRYMAPEQVRAQPLSAQTDIYALGCVIYEMLTGEPVFKGGQASSLAAAHVKLDPPHPTAGGEKLVGPLVDFMNQCLEKFPEDRPASGTATIARAQSWNASSVRCASGAAYPPAEDDGHEPPPTVQLYSKPRSTRPLDADEQRPAEVGLAPTQTLEREAMPASSTPSPEDSSDEELPSDFERIPSLMWKHRSVKPSDGTQHPAQNTKPILAPHNAEDPERKRATMGPDGVEAMEATRHVASAPATPSVAFSLDQFRHAKAHLQQADAQTAERPLVKWGVIIGLLAGIAAVVFILL